MPDLANWQRSGATLLLGEDYVLVGEMRIERPDSQALDHARCHYGESKLVFRGPARALEQPYVVCLGGTETFGRFVPRPYPDLLEGRLGYPCINLGCVNAGLDSFVTDPGVLEIASNAALCVVQLTGAQDLSNRYYRVHPRRNDRFLSATPELIELFPQIDFTEFHFTKHLLSVLSRADPDGFSLVRRELQRTWVDRMRALLSAIGTPIVLLWLKVANPRCALGHDPLLVSEQMFKALRSTTQEAVELPLHQAVDDNDLKGMVHAPMEAPIARHLIGPRAHSRIAEALARVLAEN